MFQASAMPGSLSVGSPQLSCMQTSASSAPLLLLPELHLVYLSYPTVIRVCLLEQAVYMEFAVSIPPFPLPGGVSIIRLGDSNYPLRITHQSVNGDVHSHPPRAHALSMRSEQQVSTKQKQDAQQEAKGVVIVFQFAAVGMWGVTGVVIVSSLPERGCDPDVRNGTVYCS
eukprot:766146-Hanusia_phi.AAC.2